MRSSRSDGTYTEDLTWSTAGGLPLLLDDGAKSYIYGPSSAPIAEIVDGSSVVHYLHADLIGSTRVITDHTGAVVGATRFDEYGNRTGHSGIADSAIGYSGNLTDQVTGLVYLRARDYDAATAQFMSVDPAVDSTHQPYAYVANDPLQLTDPTGLDGFTDVEDWIARGLLNGPGANALSLVNGFYDGLTWGMTSEIRQGLGVDCVVAKDGFWGVGVGGGVATSLFGAGEAVAAARGIYAAGRAAIEGVAAFRAASVAGTVDHIALGLGAEGLEASAAQVGARTLLKDPEWQSTLLSAVATPTAKFSVFLDGMSGASTYAQVMSAAQRGAAAIGSLTDWEMAQLFGAGRLSGASFFRGGSLLVNPFG